jgi:hypothetical protein
MNGKQAGRSTRTALGPVAKLSRKSSRRVRGSGCSDSTNPLGWVPQKCTAPKFRNGVLRDRSALAARAEGADVDNFRIAGQPDLTRLVTSNGAATATCAVRTPLPEPRSGAPARSAPDPKQVRVHCGFHVCVGGRIRTGGDIALVDGPGSRNSKTFRLPPDS